MSPSRISQQRHWFSSLPDNDEERKNFESWLQYDLAEQFKNSLPNNLKFLGDPDAKRIAELQNRFDAFLLANAERLGPRLLCCGYVRKRLIYWHDHHLDGPRHISRFYGALQRHVEVYRGEAKGELSPSDYSVRKELLKELRALQRRLRTLGVASHRALGWPEIDAELTGRPHVYGRLFQQRLVLQQFCKKSSGVASSFAIGALTPADFLNELCGWSSNRDPESYRQAISHLGSQKISRPSRNL